MDVIEKARELGAAIQQDKAYKALVEAMKNNDENAQLQEKIEQFNIKKVALNRETNLEEKNSEKIARLDREMREAYAEIMADPCMLAYSAAKNDIEAIMKKISALLDLTLNGEDPLTVDIHEGGCGGNCSECGGCH